MKKPGVKKTVKLWREQGLVEAYVKNMPTWKPM